MAQGNTERMYFMVKGYRKDSHIIVMAGDRILLLTMTTNSLLFHTSIKLRFHTKDVQKGYILWSKDIQKGYILWSKDVQKEYILRSKDIERTLISVIALNFVAHHENQQTTFSPSIKTQVSYQGHTGCKNKNLIFQKKHIFVFTF